MSCIKVGTCTKDTYCTTPPRCAFYTANMDAAVEGLRAHMSKYPTRQLCHTTAEAEAYWQQLDWWYDRLYKIVKLMGELKI